MNAKCKHGFCKMCGGSYVRFYGEGVDRVSVQFSMIGSSFFVRQPNKGAPPMNDKEATPNGENWEWYSSAIHQVKRNLPCFVNLPLRWMNGNIICQHNPLLEQLITERIRELFLYELCRKKKKKKWFQFSLSTPPLRRLMWFFGFIFIEGSKLIVLGTTKGVS